MMGKRATTPQDFRVGQPVWQHSTIDDIQSYSRGITLLAVVIKLGRKRVKIEREIWRDQIWVKPWELTDAQKDIDEYGSDREKAFVGGEGDRGDGLLRM